MGNGFMPRIGLLSDSHGRATATAEGAAQLAAAGAERLVHLGDVGTPEVLDAMLVPGASGGETLPGHVVFGNTDADVAGLSEHARRLGLSVEHPVGRLRFDGVELVFCHGHEGRPMNAALDEGVAYLCHGHTHRQKDQRQGPTRVINPGALFRARQYSVALLTTETDDLAFLPVDAG